MDIIYFNNETGELKTTPCEWCEEIETNKPLRQMNTKEVRLLIKDLIKNLIDKK